MFSHADGSPWKKSEQSRPIREACEHARITPAVGFHTLRHTWASLAVMARVPLLVVAKNLGHKDTRMVEHHYGHLAPSFITEAIRAGGLGHLGIQYAKVMGLQVCAVDVDDGKLALAKKVGADFVVNAKHGDPAEAVKKGTNGGAHGVLITAPSLGAFKQGVGMTRKRGTCVLVGLPPGDFPVPLFDVVANCITIRGSFVGTREDMAETLAFAAEGKVKADIELQPLSAINDIFDRLEHGKVAGRVVLDFIGTKADNQKAKAPAAKKTEAAFID
jgi:hypothetical protein